MMNEIFIENDEVFAENDGVFIENDKFSIENDETCVTYDEMWIKNDENCSGTASRSNAVCGTTCSGQYIRIIKATICTWFSL